jgi:hypothetical protein
VRQPADEASAGSSVDGDGFVRKDDRLVCKQVRTHFRSTRPVLNAIATACALVWTPSFARICWMCVATVFELITSVAAI